MTNLSLEEFENGVKIYQDENLYKFTSDAIKLAKFCNIKRTDNVLDMCAGCGVVGFYAYSLNPCNKIYFNEIQQPMCELVDINIKLNGLQDKCTILNKDLNKLSLSDFDKPLDVVVCNPPYFKLNGKIKQDQNIAMCRHEIAANLKQIIQKVGSLIKSQGKFYTILPADRMCEAIALLGHAGLEVKQVQIFNTDGVATVCIFEAVKGGKPGVKIKIVKEK